MHTTIPSFWLHILVSLPPELCAFPLTLCNTRGKMKKNGIASFVRKTKAQLQVNMNKGEGEGEGACKEVETKIAFECSGKYLSTSL